MHFVWFRARHAEVSKPAGVGMAPEVLTRSHMRDVHIMKPPVHSVCYVGTVGGMALSGEWHCRGRTHTHTHACNTITNFQCS